MKNQTKELIFNGALKAFSERGYNETNMEEIARACSIAKGTLYYNFKNKQELYIFILKTGMDRFVEQMKREMDLIPTEHIMERVEQLFELHFNFMREEQDFCRLLVSKGWVANEHHFDIRQVLDSYFTYMEHEIDSAKQLRFIAQELDTKTITNCVFGIYIFMPMSVVIGGDGAPDPQIRRTVRTFIYNALGLKAPQL